MQTRYIRRVGIFVWSVLAVFGLLLVAGCGDPTATATVQATAQPTGTPLPPPTPTPAPDAKSIAKGAADKMQTLSAFHFVIKVIGAPQLVTGVTLSAADGDLVKPDKISANLGVVVANSLRVNSQAIGVGEESYFKNPLSKKWDKMPPDWGFRPQTFFDADKGIGGIVTRIENIQIVNSESVDGADSWHLAGIVAGKDVAPISANTLGTYPVNFDVWVGKGDSLVRKITMKEIVPGVTPGTTPVAGTPIPSDWTMTFSEFNKSVDIKKPDGV